jgi:hypothetical protein
MDNQEKYIYNCYIETIRKFNDKPFRYRKNFEGFENTTEYVCVAKLGKFFDKFQHLVIKDFFEAPYFVYGEKYFDLAFYLSQRAIKAYTIYHNTFIPNNPDHDQTIEKIKDSFIFIYKFCKDNGINMSDYIKYKQEGSNCHSFLLHLKERKICLYPLFSYDGVDKIISEYESDVKRFMFGKEISNLNFFRTKYYTSSKCKKACNIIFNKLISNF